jgi:signal transduction histidine kinase
MFYRATLKSEGAGLGLYIVKEAVSKLQGTIQVESEFGSGTRFRLELPNNAPIA